MTLNQEWEIYELDGNIYNTGGHFECLTITASNIRIEGNSYTIYGEGYGGGDTGDIAIYGINKDNIVINDINIDSFGGGIYLENISGLTIQYSGFFGDKVDDEMTAINIYDFNRFDYYPMNIDIKDNYFTRSSVFLDTGSLVIFEDNTMNMLSFAGPPSGDELLNFINVSNLDIYDNDLDADNEFGNVINFFQTESESFILNHNRLEGAIACINFDTDVSWDYIVDNYFDCICSFYTNHNMNNMDWNFDPPYYYDPVDYPYRNIIGGNTFAGNYYKDYADICIDANEDGICDNSRPITYETCGGVGAFGTDDYPLSSYGLYEIYAVNFFVRDSATWTPINNSFISMVSGLYSYSGYTDIDGRLTLYVIAETYSYQISQTGYNPHTGNINVNEIENINVNLNRDFNSITFMVTDCNNSNSINNAQVCIQTVGQSLCENTSANGQAIFENTYQDVNYEYHIIKPGFFDFSGNIIPRSNHITVYDCLIPDSITTNITLNMTDCLTNLEITSVFISLQSIYNSSLVYSCQTGNSNSCDINNIPLGNYNLIIQRLEYSTIEREIIILHSPSGHTLYDYCMDYLEFICELTVFVSDSDFFPIEYANVDITQNIGNITNIITSGYTDEFGVFSTFIRCDTYDIEGSKIYYSSDKINITLNPDFTVMVDLYLSPNTITTYINGFIIDINGLGKENESDYQINNVDICIYDREELISCSTSYNNGIFDGYFEFYGIGNNRDITFKYSKEGYINNEKIIEIDIFTKNNPINLYISSDSQGNFINKLFFKGWTIKDFYWYISNVVFPFLCILIAVFFINSIRGK
jgi:hypothetical protein